LSFIIFRKEIEIMDVNGAVTEGAIGILMMVVNYFILKKMVMKRQDQIFLWRQVQAIIHAFVHVNGDYSRKWKDLYDAKMDEYATEDKQKNKIRA
jgi:hypothetical protein